jgi:hypothetical protein
MGTIGRSHENQETKPLTPYRAELCIAALKNNDAPQMTSMRTLGSKQTAARNDP